jgi:hypothetical protein
MFPQVQAQNPRLNKYTLGEGLTFTGGKDYSINLRGYFQPYYEVKAYTDPTLEDNLSRFRMRRLRLRLSGEAAQQKIEYRFQADFSGNSETGDEAAGFLFDAWVAYNINRRWSVTLGQKVARTDNRELAMGSNTLMLPERSRVTSAFASIREFGLFVDGTIRMSTNHYLRPHAALTNGDGLNVFGRDRGGLKVGGRLDYLPFGLFSYYGQFRQADLARELSPKLVVGVNYSLNYGMSSRRGRSSGDILYLNDAGEESLPNYTKYGVDFMFKYRGFTLLGEFVGTQATVPLDITQRVRNDGTTSRTFEVDGQQDVENYVKGRMMLGMGYNLQMGYVFKNLISIDGRYTHLDADQHSFLNNGTFYNRPNYYTLGVSKYFVRGYGFKIQASVTYVEAASGSNDVTGSPMNGNEWISRIITTFSF